MKKFELSKVARKFALVAAAGIMALPVLTNASQAQAAAFGHDQANRSAATAGRDTSDGNDRSRQPAPRPQNVQTFRDGRDSQPDRVQQNDRNRSDGRDSQPARVEQNDRTYDRNGRDGHDNDNVRVNLNVVERPNFVDRSRVIVVDNNNYDQTFSGRVTLISSDDAFNVDINGRVYNVYCNGPIPYDLCNGDWVSITGLRDNGDDISNAYVSVTGR